MTATHTVIVYNPGSGNGCHRRQVLELGTQPGFQIWPVKPDSDPRRVAAKARRKGIATVVAAGGDGTINGVVNGLMGEDRGSLPVLAVLPCGSANDLTKALGIGPEWEPAAAALAAGHTRALDLIQVGGAEIDVLINAATGGLSVEINEEMDEETKRWWGGFAYARAALEVVPKARNYRIFVDADGEALADEVAAVIISNGTHAGGVSLMPPADPGDGALDLAAVLTTTFGERARLFADFALGHHLESDLVIYRQVSHVKVESEPPMPFIGDGEPIGETPLTFEVLPAALQVIVAPEAEAEAEEI